VGYGADRGASSFFGWQGGNVLNQSRDFYEVLEPIVFAGCGQPGFRFGGKGPRLLGRLGQTSRIPGRRRREVLEPPCNGGTDTWHRADFLKACGPERFEGGELFDQAPGATLSNPGNPEQGR